MIKFERILRFLLLSMLLIFPCNGQGLSSEAGFPFIKNYTAKEYGAHTQNWAIVQDARGVMYFGNTAGGCGDFSKTCRRGFYANNVAHYINISALFQHKV